MKYKLFGNSGLRVSEISLGTMTFGTEWGWGADEETSKEIFDAYAEAGGNFIDTANRYTEGSSEKMVGDFIREDRDHFVLATKYSLFDRQNDLNFSGNHRKNLFRSVNESLRRMETEYIDILWLHAWDFTTPVQEVMRAMEDLIRMGVVHYIGISDTPAWIVSQANTLADLKGWTSFAGLQIEYNLIERSAERDLIPMSKAFNMAVTPWAPLAGGALTGKYLQKNDDGRIKEESDRRNDRSNRIAQKVVEVANDIGATPAQVALKWTMQKDFLSIPIVGARKTKQIQDSLKALDITIPEKHMEALNKVSKVRLGFPHEFLNSPGVKSVSFGDAYDRLDNPNDLLRAK